MILLGYGDATPKATVLRSIVMIVHSGIEVLAERVLKVLILARVEPAQTWRSSVHLSTLPAHLSDTGHRSLQMLAEQSDTTVIVPVLLVSRLFLLGEIVDHQLGVTALRWFEFNDARSVLCQVILHQPTGLFLVGIDGATVLNRSFLFPVLDNPAVPAEVRREELLLVLLAARLQILELGRII